MRRGRRPTSTGWPAKASCSEDVYSHCPLTLPSHASMLTGLLPVRTTACGTTSASTLGREPRHARHALPRRRVADGRRGLRLRAARGDRHRRRASSFYDDAIEVEGRQRVDRRRSSATERRPSTRSSRWISGQGARALLRLPPPLRAALALRAAAALPGQGACPTTARSRTRTSSSAGCSSALALRRRLRPRDRGAHLRPRRGAERPRRGGARHLRLPRGGARAARPAPARRGARRHPRGRQRRRRSTSRPRSWTSPACPRPVSTASRCARPSRGRRSRATASTRRRSTRATTSAGASCFAATEGRYRYVRAPRPELFDLTTDGGERHDIAGDRATCRRGHGPLARHAGRGRGRGHARRGARRRPREAAGARLRRGRRAPRVASGPLPDPKDHIAAVRGLQAARWRCAWEDSGEEAVAQLRRVVRDNPDMRDAWEMLGRDARRARPAGRGGRGPRPHDRRSTRTSPSRTWRSPASYVLEGRRDAALQHAEIAARREPGQGVRAAWRRSCWTSTGRTAAADYARRSLQADERRV